MLFYMILFRNGKGEIEDCVKIDNHSSSVCVCVCVCVCACMRMCVCICIFVCLYIVIYVSFVCFERLHS